MAASMKIILSFLLCYPLFSFATECKNIVLPQLNIDISSIQMVDLTDDLQLHTGEIAQLMNAAYGDRANAPENYILITPEELKRMIKAGKLGTLPSFELDPLEKVAPGHLRRLPGLLLALFFWIEKGFLEKRQVPLFISRWSQSLAQARQVNLVFDQDMTIPKLLPIPNLSLRAKKNLSLVNQSTAASTRLRFKLNPFFDQLRPDSFGKVLHSIFSDKEGIHCAKFYPFRDLIDFNLFESKLFLASLNFFPNGRAWEVFSGAIVHEGFHALSYTAGFDIVKIAKALSGLVEFVLNAIDKNQLKTLVVAENFSYLVRRLSLIFSKSPEDQRTNQISQVFNIFFGDTLLDEGKLNKLTSMALEQIKRENETHPEVPSSDFDSLDEILDPLELTIFYNSWVLFDACLEMFEELLAHRFGGHILDPDTYDFPRELLDEVAATMLPRWRSFFLKPNVFGDLKLPEK